MRCKHGDLAIIVHDFLGCEGNIGVIVQVVGPPESHPATENICWGIKPVKRRKLWFVCERLSQQQYVSKQNKALHPDAWLLPIRSDDIDLGLKTEVPIQSELVGELN